MASTNEISQSLGPSHADESGSDKNNTTIKSGDAKDYKESTEVDYTLGVIDDVAALPKGTVDPVYEAKARVLNKAVRQWRNCA